MKKENSLKSCTDGRQEAGQSKGADAIDHPHHYARWPMEPIEFIAINDLPWWLANVIKYTMRHDAKEPLKDLYKARSYLEMKIRHLEGLKRFWEKPVEEERKANRREEKVQNVCMTCGLVLNGPVLCARHNCPQLDHPIQSGRTDRT